MIEGWQAEALNTAPDSANEIHGDDMAQRFGFKGGLVPGVTISAYLIQPAVTAWGMDFLTRGAAHVRVTSPLYDGERFQVNILTQTNDRYEAELIRPDGSVSASTEVDLPELAAAPPARKQDPIVAPDFVGPPASIDMFTRLQQEGCVAYRHHWGAKHRMQHYLRDDSLMPEILTGQDACANMSYLLGISNWILAGNAYMNPWVHLETTSQNYGAVPRGTNIIAEMRIVDFFEKKGHEFVDADVAMFDESDDACLMTVRLRAIYRLRGS